MDIPTDADDPHIPYQRYTASKALPDTLEGLSAASEALSAPSEDHPAQLEGLSASFDVLLAPSKPWPSLIPLYCPWSTL